MQQPSQSPLSPAFLVETFDNFFSETLSRDSNYSLFQKEWQNFKVLLNKDSLDLDQIFSYIAQVQANLLTVQQPTQAIQATQPVIQHTKPSQLANRSRALSPIDTSFSLEKPPVKTPGSRPRPTSTYEKSNSLFEIQEIEGTPKKTLDNQPLIFPSSMPDAEPSPVKIDTSTCSPYATRRPQSSTPTPTYSRAFSLLPANYSPSNKLTMTEAAPSRFNMGFLMEKSKTTKRKLEENNEAFLQNYKVLGGKGIQTRREERSLLRKVKIHSKKANPEEVARSIDRQIDNILRIQNSR